MKNACEALGAAAFFEKPVDFEALKARSSHCKKTYESCREAKFEMSAKGAVETPGTDPDGRILRNSPERRTSG